ncbi:MAG TPA: inorganic phosphate transporter [Saprospiraceae bacterium]|nr:inorganic phosphate transporter [Saprospiraceae bacterium]
MALAFIADLPFSASVLLIICLLAVCLFEAINGFHDTANAVATVIYTNTLKPVQAVIWSGIWNFIGVYVGGIAVAMGIIKLIPLNDLMMQPIEENSALVLSILLAAIAWNLGTWYLGIPCSSSHTLIGSLLGAGFAFWSIHQGAGPNWAKAGEIGLSLLVSPLFGFSLAILLMYILKNTIRSKRIFKEPTEKKPPPFWIRAVLVTTCTLVSFFHGSNDGQKGVGLLLVVLIAFMPMQYALNHNVPLDTFKTAARSIEATLTQSASGEHADHILALAAQAGRTAAGMDSVDMKDKSQLFTLRKSIQSLNKNIEADLKSGLIPATAKNPVKHELKTLKTAYEFAPLWAIILIAVCLGIGTMIGWKRIVVTIGEKIGKTHLTYAQGASAELCAAATIGLSTGLGLPVSTTHVLSSGIAGTMVASGGIKNLQRKTIKNIAIAWLLTLPVTFLMSALFFLLLRLFF